MSGARAAATAATAAQAALCRCRCGVFAHGAGGCYCGCRVPYVDHQDREEVDALELWRASGGPLADWVNGWCREDLPADQGRPAAVAGELPSRPVTGPGRPPSPDAAATRAAILSAPSSTPSTKLAAELRAAGVADVTPAYIRQVRLDAGEHRGAGGGQVTGAITYSKAAASARARALLDQLLADSQAAGLEPEAYLERARGGQVAARP